MSVLSILKEIAMLKTSKRVIEFQKNNTVYYRCFVELKSFINVLKIKNRIHLHLETVRHFDFICRCMCTFVFVQTK